MSREGGEKNNPPAGFRAWAEGHPAAESGLSFDIKGQYDIDKVDEQYQPLGEHEALARLVAQVLKRSRINVTDEA